jgi:iron complex outermembrane recepter protein
MSKGKSSLLRSTILVSVVLGALSASGAALAQTAPPSPAVAAPEAEKPKTVDTVVVTGSRVRRDEFNSASPIEIITRDEAILAGTATTTEILQGSAVTSGAAQVNNTFLGFVTEGGPGANTVSLRGLGAVRTLVLLNGRRLAPAGSRGQVAPADVNVLPSAMVSRIEVLKDGASSVYGSDAVAGVVNIITRTGIDDTTIEGFTDQTFEGGAAQYSASIVWGKTMDRLQVAASAEYNKSERLVLADRDYTNCPTDNRYSPTTGAFLGQVGANGLPRCFPIGVSGAGGLAQNYVVATLFPSFAGRRYTPDSTAAIGTGNLNRNLNGWKNVDPLQLRPDPDPLIAQDDLYSPVQTGIVYANASYDLRALGNAEIYGEFLYSHRESEFKDGQQLGLDPFGFDALGFYGPTAGQFGLPAASPFLPTAFAAAGVLAVNPLIYWGQTTTSAEVNYLRANVGLRGELPFKNWRYDGNVMYSKSDATYQFQAFFRDRLAQSLDVVAAVASTPSNLVVTAPAGTLGAGGRYTCRVNITNPNAGCIAANLLTADALKGNVPADLRSWLSGNVDGATQFTQVIAQFSVDGDLFEGPAGPIGFAIGAEFRWDDLLDTPAAQSRNRNLYGLTSADVTKGKDQVSEVFGEIDAPLVANKPLVQELRASLSGRYTDYDSYGSNSTYKFGMNWTPIGPVRLRATIGTSFRAPGVFELELGGQSGFYGPGVDPCDEFEALAPTSPRYINCKAALSAAIGDNVTEYAAFAGPEVYQVGGNLARKLGITNGLTAETSEAKTLGVILQPELTGRDFTFAVDWFEIIVEDQIDSFGSSVLSSCYDQPVALFNAKGGFCKLIGPRRSDGALTTFQDPYTNVASSSVEGWDFNVRYSQKVGTGTLRATLRATVFDSQIFQLTPTDEPDDFNGALRAPDVTGDLTLSYDWKDWVFRYQADYVAAMDSNPRFGLADDNVSGFKLKVEPTITHTVSFQYESPQKWFLAAGINNITAEEPPTISSGTSTPRIGNSLNYSGYDFRGRSAFVRVSKTF